MGMRLPDFGVFDSFRTTIDRQGEPSIDDGMGIFWSRRPSWTGDLPITNYRPILPLHKLSLLQQKTSTIFRPHGASSPMLIALALGGTG